MGTTPDWSLIISFIALAVAVISPFLVAVANNRHQEKMYRLQSHSEHVRAAITGYLEYACTVISSAYDSEEEFAEYKKCYMVLFLHSSDDLRSLMVNLDINIKSNDHDLSFTKLENITRKLSDEFPQYSNNRRN